MVVATQELTIMTNTLATRERRQFPEGQPSFAAENLKAYDEIAALKVRSEGKNIDLRDEILTEHNFEEIPGNSPELLKLLDRVESTAPTEANVLITGDPGTAAL
jgi:formate hydrogenlyase transcriptional activator